MDLLSIFRKFLSKSNQNKNLETTVIPDHHSPVRHMVSEAHGLKYEPIEDFATARKVEDAVVIFEGDWGGQIYLTCPMRLIKCSEEDLSKLLDELDKIAWECNDGEGKAIFYERRKVGEGISGGMGGGVILNDLWIHEEFVDTGMVEKIRQTITGESSIQKAI